MKLIKIGRADSCNLRLDSDYVSELHAEMTILDDGKIILEDKDSTNGTTIGNKRIKPGKEVEVQRGDRIMFADTELNWAKIPYPEKLTNYKAVYSIGNHYRNAIIINDSTISRFHASLRIGKDGKNYIRDNGSLNGTKVNGLKISPNIDYHIKKGKDRVICGSQDITEQIDPFLVYPSSPVNNLGNIAEDSYKQGKNCVKENVLPQLDMGMEKFKKNEINKIKKDYWIVAGVGCVILFVIGVFFCIFLLSTFSAYGGIESDDNSEQDEYEQSHNNNTITDEFPYWIVGKWYCVTPYGNMQLEISGGYITEIDFEGNSFFGKYHIQGDDIMTESGSGMYYRMDKSSQRLSAGQGYYFEKY